MTNYLKYQANVKFASEDSNDGFIHFSGVASSATVDRHGDVIDVSFWSDDTISKYMENPVLLYSHDMRDVCGRVTKAWVEEDKLRIEGVVSKSWDKAWQVEQGIVKSLSVSVSFNDYDVLPTGGLLIRSGDWMETSLTAIGANQEAMFSLSKDFSQGDQRDQIIHKIKNMNFLEQLTQGLKKTLGLEVEASEEAILEALQGEPLETRVADLVEKSFAQKAEALKKSVEEAPVFDFTTIQEAQAKLQEAQDKLQEQIEALASQMETQTEALEQVQKSIVNKHTAPNDDGVEYKTIENFKTGVKALKVGTQKSFKK